MTPEEQLLDLWQTHRWFDTFKVESPATGMSPSDLGTSDLKKLISNPRFF
jgi:hypothetical protein